VARTHGSFINCPGHAELMAMMLAGASAFEFDDAVFAAAANTPGPSPQAMQHNRNAFHHEPHNVRQRQYN
jgi:translation initiation factor 2 gamma subunit (eIF-2gamma)